MYVDHDKPLRDEGGECANLRSPSENLTPAGAFVSLVSSTPAYATPGALTAPATTNFFVAAVILGLFVLSAGLSAERKAISAGFHGWPTPLMWRISNGPVMLGRTYIDAASRPANFQFTGQRQLPQSSAAVLPPARGFGTAA